MSNDKLVNNVLLGGLVVGQEAMLSQEDKSSRRFYDSLIVGCFGGGAAAYFLYKLNPTHSLEIILASMVANSLIRLLIN